jgi:tetratricopeptide (TPR) repeat protein
MNTSSLHAALRIFSVAAAACLALAPISHAQGGMTSNGQGQGPSQMSVNAMATRLHMATDVQTQTTTDVDPKEKAAYEKFYNANSEAVDQKIQIGNEFRQQYPSSVFTEAVDVGLTNLYYQKQDWKDYYTTADQALAINPDEVDVLTTLGWVIPHMYNAADPDASQKLQTAETYEKHAIEVLAKMPKPSYLNDEQFAASKAGKTLQAHSALGLVYFRRGDYANSAAELHLATDNNADPDPIDLYILGNDLQKLGRPSDAAVAFGRCGQIAGVMQDRCKQSADTASKLAAQPKP